MKPAYPDAPEADGRGEISDLPSEAKMYPETFAGAYSHRDCTVAFYTRIDALLDPHMTVLNIGAGRGANILADRSAYRRKIQVFQGRASKVIGLDVDPVVKDNPDLDESHVIEPIGRYPIDDEAVDLIVCDHVLEHVEYPVQFVAEINRVLKPGGWFCARTPAKWGYIGLGARAIPNEAHVKLLRHLQPQRKAQDVFPTFYRMNTRSRLREAFPAGQWRDCTYGYNGVPGYHANVTLLFKAIEAWCWLMPRSLSAKYHVFMQKIGA